MRLNFKAIAHFTGILLISLSSSLRAQSDTSHVELMYTVTLQNITGRLGQMAYNGKQGVIYLAALSNNTLEVIDLQNKKTVRSIKSLRQPIDVEFQPNSDLIFVACLGDGLCRVFNTNTFKEETSFRFDNNVSLVKYSPAFQMVYIGYGEGAIALVDANTLKYKTTIKLPVHPEAACVDENAGIMFINLPKNREIGVIDLKSNTVGSSLKLSESSENYPLAYDKDNKRLFIGCRKPSQLLVINSENGSKISSLNIDGDVNEIYYDGSKHQIYVTCGDGYLHIIKQEIKEVKQLIKEPKPTGTQNKPVAKSSSKNPKNNKQTKKPAASKPTQPQYKTVLQDNYTTLARIFTANGARTSVFIPESSQIIVAAPAFADKDARLLVYRIK
ncbi:MAG: WD40 repeat domain-containing protein [Bacteroidales bacterium]|nr:WD40 repeat domain-containing protein [Bacteroidales bacterium]